MTLRRVQLRSYKVIKPFIYAGMQFETGSIFDPKEFNCPVHKLERLVSSRNLDAVALVSEEEALLRTEMAQKQKIKEKEVTPTVEQEAPAELESQQEEAEVKEEPEPETQLESELEPEPVPARTRRRS